MTSLTKTKQKASFQHSGSDQLRICQTET